MTLLKSAFLALFAPCAVHGGLSAAESAHDGLAASNARWASAYDTLDGAAFAALYASDAVLMVPGKAPIKGAEAIGQFWADLIKPATRKNIALDPLA